MGRDLAFYAVTRDVAHEPSRLICLNWECEPTYDDFKHELDDHLQQKDAHKTYMYMYNLESTEANQEWCPRCAMFTNGLSNSKAVVDGIDFIHSYSNPIWRSDWHFYNMYPGNDHTDFVNRFDSKCMYREMFQDDVERLKRGLATCGKAYRKVDLEATEETKKVVAFCEKWLLKNDEYMIIYSSEL